MIGQQSRDHAGRREGSLTRKRPVVQDNPKDRTGKGFQRERHAAAAGEGAGRVEPHVKSKVPRASPGGMEPQSARLGYDPSLYSICTNFA